MATSAASKSTPSPPSSGTTPSRHQSTNGMNSLVKGYLVSYNVVQASGWLLVLMNTVQYVTSNYDKIGLTKGVPGLYELIQRDLLVFQTLAVLEVVHSILGLVRSNVMTNVMQVYSRLFILWGIIHTVENVADSFGLVLAVLAWSVTEVIRYSFYGFGLVGSVPYIVTWLRYTLFYILYPIGVLGELMMAFTALPVIKATGQFSISLPNCLNFSFSYYYYVIFTIFLYIPAFPQLYGHMIKQRAKVIGGHSQDKPSGSKPKAE